MEPAAPLTLALGSTFETRWTDITRTKSAALSPPRNRAAPDVPVFVLEFLLGKYCASSDEVAIQMGMQVVNDKPLNSPSADVSLLPAGPGTDRPWYKNDLNNFGPRVGVSFRLDDKTVVRGGFGWSYNRIGIGSAVNDFENNMTPSVDYRQTSLATLQSFTGLAPITARSFGAEEARALSSGRHKIAVRAAGNFRLTGSVKELHSAFSNLVSNAVRYTPEHGEIEIGCDGVRRVLLLDVGEYGHALGADRLPVAEQRAGVALDQPLLGEAQQTVGTRECEH